jgi:DNA integrity scanning protein DisA with diadenylate cyclase activity
VGITEQTDAVCLVVSEERGAVSLVVEGVIERVNSADELVARLCRLLGGKPVES